MLRVIHFPFGVVVPSYDVMLALAIVVCWVVGPLWARRLEGIPVSATLRALAMLGVAAFVGAHVHYVAAHWRSFTGAPWAMLRVWSGLHAPGGIAALALAAPWVLRRSGISIGRFADALLPTIGVGIAVARVGCFLNGCCYGTPCDWPWCVSFPVIARAQARRATFDIGLAEHAAAGPVHPLQLYFAAVGVLIALLGIWRHRRKRYDGEPALLGLLLFSVSAALLEFLRARNGVEDYWGPLPQLAWVGLAMTACTVAALVIAERRHERRMPGSAAVRA